MAIVREPGRQERQQVRRAAVEHLHVRPAAAAFAAGDGRQLIEGRRGDHRLFAPDAERVALVDQHAARVAVRARRADGRDVAAHGHGDAGRHGFRPARPQNPEAVDLEATRVARKHEDPPRSAGPWRADPHLALRARDGRRELIGPRAGRSREARQLDPGEVPAGAEGCPAAGVAAAAVRSRPAGAAAPAPRPRPVCATRRKTHAAPYPPASPGAVTTACSPARRRSIQTVRRPGRRAVRRTAAASTRSVPVEAELKDDARAVRLSARANQKKTAGS